MKYIVYDGICYKEYSNYESAERDAFITEGIITKVNTDGSKEIICDYRPKKEETNERI